MLELIAITRITMFDAGKTSEERFQTPWTYLPCMWSTDTHFWGTHTNRGGYFIVRGKLNSCFFVKQQLLTPAELWTQWEPRSAAACRAVNHLQVLPLNETAFCKNSLETATACCISVFMRSRASCWILRYKCNCICKQKAVKTLDGTFSYTNHLTDLQKL